VLLGLTGVLWALRPETSAAPPEAPEPVATAVRVTVDPAMVQAGTKRVRVSALCEHDAVAVSDAWADKAPLTESTAGSRSGEVELSRGLSPGRYRVIVSCEWGRVGESGFTITEGPGTPSPAGDPRVATTRVVLTPAGPDDRRDHPEVNVDPREPGWAYFKVLVTHEVTVPAGDRDVADVRAGAAGASPTAFAQARLGAVTTDSMSSLLAVAFATPVVSAGVGSDRAVITYTGVGYSRVIGDDYIGIQYLAPGVSRLTAHDVYLSATGLTVAGVRGPPPLTQDAHHLRLSGDSPARVAFVQDGRSAAVAEFLYGDRFIAGYLEGRDARAVTEEPEPPNRMWTALQWVSGAAAVLVLLRTFAGALGAEWWRRRRNRVLVAVLLIGLGLTAGGPQWIVPAGYIVLPLVAVPLLAVFSTFRAAGRESGAVAQAGVVATLFAGSALCLCWLASFFGLDVTIPMTLVPIALCWAALVYGWATEAGHQWAPRYALWWVGTASVAIGIVVYARLDFFDRLADEVVWTGMPLLALAMFVVRARRLGQDAEAPAGTVPFHTAVLVMLSLHAPGGWGSPVMWITILLEWAGLSVLLRAPRRELVRPVSEEEHRSLVRDMVRRRSVRAALTNLLREPHQGQDFDERRTTLERAAENRGADLDSDLALSTTAGRTPWQNAMAAFWAGAVLSLPFSAVRLIETATSGLTTPDQVVVAGLSLSWLPALCGVFGYFYPRVRGAGPIAKSMALLLVALVSEVPAFALGLGNALTDGGQTPEEALVAWLVTVGNFAVVTIGLGLWWEWRLMALAGEPWGRIRNVRTLRALGAPLAAVTIAIATTTATALVNNVITPLPSGSVTEQRTGQAPGP
jgi:hypothetical protein